MLIAVAIIGTLTVATVPHVSGLQARARDLVRVMHMRDIGHAIEAYAIEQNTYPSSSYTDTTALTPLLHNYLTSMPTDPNDMGISNTQ